MGAGGKSANVVPQVDIRGMADELSLTLEVQKGEKG